MEARDCRQYAQYCTAISKRTIDPQLRLTLLNVALAWLKHGEEIETNGDLNRRVRTIPASHIFSNWFQIRHPQRPFTQ